MIRTLCTFLVLACVAGLSGVLTGHLFWNRYADENGLLGFSKISERILAARASLVDVAQGYWAATDPRDSLIREASAFEE
jgi:hypothetical protein